MLLLSKLQDIWIWILRVVIGLLDIKTLKLFGLALCVKLSTDAIIVSAASIS